MKKRIVKTFNVKDAQNGAIVETKNGQQVRIICYDRIGTGYPIIALLNYKNVESCLSYNIDGKLCNSENSNNDLVIITEIETKFDEGDYIVSDIGNIYEITKIDEMYHTKQLSSGYEQRWTIEDIHRSFHKWSLNDAKLGYVLCCEDGRPFMFKEARNGHPVAYFGVDTTNHICIGLGNVWTISDIRPATYREYNSLFKQLKHEGYEYNINTHEITKQDIWRNKEGLSTKMSGYYINIDSSISSYDNGILCKTAYNVFNTKKQAKAALAMARISQIMANDKRFGGVITDEKWNNKYNHVILRKGNYLDISIRHSYQFLAFHEKEQAELFLKENEDLIKDFYMIDQINNSHSLIGKTYSYAINLSSSLSESSN